MKLIDDVLKDNNGAWDMVRIGAGFAAWNGTGIILYHMYLDPNFAANLTLYVTGLMGVWVGYAGAVWGHSFAKI